MKKIRLFLSVFACGLMLSAFTFNSNFITFTTEFLYVSASANVGLGDDDERETAWNCENPDKVMIICEAGSIDCTPKDC